MRNDLWELAVTWLLNQETTAQEGRLSVSKRTNTEDEESLLPASVQPSDVICGISPGVLHQDGVRVLRLVASWTSRDSQPP